MKYISRPRLAAFAWIVVALAGMTLQADATDWQGHKLTIPTNFVFGYGSLINTVSRNSTASAPIPAIPVRVSAGFGYVRSWNDRASSGFTALGLRRLRPNEIGHTINGVLYAVGDSDMAKFDAREKGYVRVEVALSEIEAVGWQRVPEKGNVWTYIPLAESGSGMPSQSVAEPNVMFPLLQSYIDVVVEGALEFGPDYARELIETTEGWSRYWLNDRELARRPWVHDPKSAMVDNLLTSTPASAAQITSRTFPEMYADRFRSEATK